MKMRRAAAMGAIAASLTLGTSCSAILDSLLESDSDRYEERRRKAYESKGVDPERARRMAFEDKVWGGSPTVIR
ncbi:MAG: hypothetical protein HKN82_16100 [Akkermansiaceae bacterium]|nr:hypothetical protein [Akkermansiaceae bacterium]NNM29393.1 hypothetical protein [Akkermansiaceae bacterium]